MAYGALAATAASFVVETGTREGTGTAFVFGLDSNKFSDLELRQELEQDLILYRNPILVCDLILIPEFVLKVTHEFKVTYGLWHRFSYILFWDTDLTKT